MLASVPGSQTHGVCRRGSRRKSKGLGKVGSWRREAPTSLSSKGLSLSDAVPLDLWTSPRGSLPAGLVSSAPSALADSAPFPTLQGPGPPSLSLSPPLVAQH